MLDFGAEPSRPASLLSTLRTHQSPGEWQDSLPACSLAFAGRDSHPLDFIEWFPLFHFWFPHSHAYPSASNRKLENLKSVETRCPVTRLPGTCENNSERESHPGSNLRFNCWHLESRESRAPNRRLP